MARTQQVRYECVVGDGGDAIQARQTEEPASCIEKTGTELEERVRTKEARIEKGPACYQVS